MLKKKHSDNKVKNLLFYLFLISIFFFKIPNFYIFPFFKNVLFTSQAIARIIIVINFLLNTYLYFKKANPKFLSFNNKLLINTVLILFIIQSLSIFSVINLEAFLSRFKDIFISLLFFILAGLYKEKIKKIILVIFLGAFLNIIYQFILVFNSDFFVKVISNFIYEKHLNYVLANLDRNRIYIDTFDEAIIPFLFLGFAVRKSFNNILAKIGVILITILSFLSNFRTRILMIIFSTTTSFFILIKGKNRKKILAVLLILLISFLFSNAIPSNIRQFYRFNDIEETLDTTTIVTRLDQVKIAFDMGKIGLFGVGLGNYFDNIPGILKSKDLILSESTKFVKLGAEEYVHNIFGFIISESGYLGLATFMCMIYLFIKNDIFLFKKNNKYNKALIISFWTVFIYGLFNPIIPASYQVLFWTIRGLLT